MIIAPRPPSRSRLELFTDRKLSYLRALEHEVIREIPLHGRVFDFGGGARAEYLKRLQPCGPIESLNIDPSMRPTFVHDANTPFPIADATYDTIITFNTLEHVRRDEHALSELVRILRPGGSIHIVVPYLCRIHGHPSDYHRHTSFWWEAALEERGIPPEQSRIQPIMWGRITTSYSFLEFTRLRFLRRLPLWADLVIKGIADDEYPLGYYISGTKPQNGP
jgi:SAM-dependent methyltransferase